MPEHPKDEYRSLSASIAVLAVPVAIVAAPVAGAVTEHVLDGRKPKDDPPPAEPKK
jgi:hypothetical protein